jgi:hypothetical protein
VLFQLELTDASAPVYAKRIGLDKAINDLKEEKKKYLNWR